MKILSKLFGGCLSSLVLMFSLFGNNLFRLQIQFDKADMHSYDVWKGCISEILKRPQSSIVNSDTATEGTNVTSAVEVRVLREGPLHIRPPKGGENWPLFTVRVTNTSVEVVESASDGLAIANSFPLTLSCAAFETNLGAHAFEVVTPTSVLHLRAENKEELDIWIKTIRDVILRSRPDPSDPLFHEAMMKINSDVIYDVVFPESKPLGIVLERAGEWGIVKISNAKDTNVFAGSALTAVNDQSVVLYNYADTISLLRGWKPPLKLVFRKAPAKEGFLMKQSTGKSASEVVGKHVLI